MGLKRRLQRLQKTARGRLAWLDLPGGQSFYYAPVETQMQLFVFSGDMLRAVRAGDPHPDPPEILKVIGGLPTPEDRERAFRVIYGAAGKAFIGFDPEILLASGEIRPHSSLKRRPDDPPPDEDGGVVLIPEPRKI